MPRIQRLHNIIPEGKLPVKVLGRVLDSVRNEEEGLVVRPSVGVDVGIVKSSGKFLVSSSDPITGASRKIGWYAVNVSANDVATSGVMPSFLTVVSLFPKGTSSQQIFSLTKEISDSASELGISIVGGHTEVTSEIKKPLIVVTCFGTGDTFVTSANAHAGDAILMTKTAGIEGTSIIANLSTLSRKVRKESVIQRAKKLVESISILKEARIGYATGVVHAMHDATEGGVIGAVVEMSIASRLGFRLQTDLIPLDPSTETICGALAIDPLRLVSSGTLLLACSENDSQQVIQAIEKAGIKCTKIGNFVPDEKERMLISKQKDGSNKIERLVDLSVQDELWTVLRKYS